ncbi:gluconate 2-dehydrogenase subunit 3 family protein [Bacillus sp. EB600]|uniref:gluconate 2-dehydrogenase subunit 3 family protein n=1 Tax=Bacillus sp. EB600 TaxID=2806345 RepID=UPI00210BCECB|nr:gluconate 2-dehydrogenase subunit 3 family protein [Bacillus sp. EB600]MCQ6281984.1 gluconate 2-dehydrogenase subunit 3 family protein [Bacillus sp. EB600]
MSKDQIHYPNFNVMDEEKQWDSHTRKIVSKRTETQSFFPFQYLTKQESNTLFQLCAVLLDDVRESIISFVVHHFDSTLTASIGESQRKVSVPKQSILLRDGLGLLDKACTQVYGSSFDVLQMETKKEIVSNLMQGNFTLQSGKINIPVKDFIQKVSSEATAAYYSHPAIWSEIGYAGPAYPRGYVRTELGLTDPWEAKRDG